MSEHCAALWLLSTSPEVWVFPLLWDKSPASASYSYSMQRLTLLFPFQSEFSLQCQFVHHWVLLDIMLSLLKCMSCSPYGGYSAQSMSALMALDKYECFYGYHHLLLALMKLFLYPKRRLRANLLHVGKETGSSGDTNLRIHHKTRNSQIIKLNARMRQELISFGARRL